MIDHIVELYSSKKSFNFKTVENSVMRLSNKTKSKPIQEKAVRKNKTRSQGKRILETVKDKSAKHARKYGDLEQFYIGSFDVRLDGAEEAFL